MKKLFFLALLCVMFHSAKAQYPTTFIAGPDLRYIYVGSLTAAENSSANASKIQVDVFGGGWGSEDIGVTTYYIANRTGLNIHQVTLGGPNNNFYSLQAFDNGADNIDFYLVSSSWTAIAVRSYLIGSTSLVTNTITASVPGTQHPINILPVLVTDDSGNMAVKTNTIDPDYAFTVNGGIRATEVRVETGWADNVFDKGYDLKPLKEVESYIKQNKHLPDVPSAADIARNGVKVGETEALLLKKVEELTLYLIEQQKINRLLQQQINSLKKQ